MTAIARSTLAVMLGAAILAPAPAPASEVFDLTLNVPATFMPGTALDVTGVLTVAATGTPLPSQDVEVIVDGVTVATVVTGNDGAWRHAVTFTSSPRSHRLRARAYGGSVIETTSPEAETTVVTRRLTVTIAGVGSGTITSAPGGIACPTDCTEDVPFGDGVTLTAVPTAGYRFAGWSGGGCSGTGSCAVTMDVARTVTATFGLPQVRFESSSSTDSEAITSVAIPVVLTPAATRTVTVDYRLSAPTQEVSLAPGRLTFAPGDTEETIMLTVIDDTTNESNGPGGTILLSSPVNAELGSPAIHVRYLLDDDPPPYVNFTAGTASGPESTSTVTVTAVLSEVSEIEATVSYSTLNGTAVAGSDYVATSGTLVFPPGVLSRSFTLTVLDDAIAELDETFEVRIGSTGNASPRVPMRVVYTIQNDD